MHHARPSPEFFETHSQAQRDDIAHSLTEHREIPLQYEYLGSGSRIWAAYSDHLETEGPDQNGLNIVSGLLRAVADNLVAHDSASSNIAVTELGVGTGIAAKGLLAYFLPIKVIRCGI
jgi:hypothetical protein